MDYDYLIDVVAGSKACIAGYNAVQAYITAVWTHRGGSVAEWLACWTQAQKARVQIAVATLSGNSLRRTVHSHSASVHQAAKLVYQPS